MFFDLSMFWFVFLPFLWLIVTINTEEVFEEDNVLDWILELHHGNTMKNVSRQSLLSMVDNYDYLAVVFCN